MAPNQNNPNRPNRPNKPNSSGALAGSAQRENVRNAEREAQQTRVRYAWLMNIIATDTTGSLRGLLDWVNKRIQRNLERARRGLPVPPQPFTQDEFDQKFNATAWRKQYTSYEAERRIEAADPNLRKDFEFRRETARNNILSAAEEYGVQLDPQDLDTLTELALFQGWDSTRIRNALGPRIAAQIEAGRDLTGTAGDVQTQLLQWAARQGISIPRDVLARLVSAGALGRQGLEDMKAEIRRMYLVGAYPGWAKQIEAGADPYDLAAPFRGEIASLLELNDEEIGLDDPLLGQAMQGGMTLTDLRRVVRKDPRWQYTDNAHKTYGNVATDLLSMFGFR